MPRMPYPHCDHACQNKNVSNASDNIKLKILEDKLRNDLVQKDLTDLPEVSEVKSSDYLYVYDSEQEQVKKISTSEILNQVDLDDYAKKEDLDGYAKKEHTHEEYLTEHQSLENYYTKEETDSKVSSEIEQAKNDVKGEIDDRGYLTEHQDLTEYAKKSELFSKDYNDLTNKPELFSGNYDDLSNKPVIPSIEGLASEEFVNNAIANIEHPANPTKVSELENDANYTSETKVLELIEKNASSKIGIDFTTDITVGRLTAGTEIKADMTIGEIIRRILMCDHNWIDATCTAPKTCSLCGKTEGEALGHIEEIIPAKAATCEETGLTEGVRCSRCGEILVEQQVIPALGHNYTSEVIKSATCTEEGLRRYTCTRCGDTYDEAIPVLAHSQAIREENRIEPDCTNSGSYDKVTYCTVCNEELGRETINLPALGHDWGDWVITKQPEVGVTGEQQRTCKRCGEVETQIIPALPKPETPSVPGIPEDSAVGNIIANSVPAYSGTASTGDKEVAFEILDTATATPTDQGLYVTYNENNEAIATGYQLTMKGNTNMDAQTFALPVGATIIRAWQYDEMGKTWLEYNFPGDYWRLGDIVTKTIGDVTYEYQSYIYNVEDIGDAISNDEYWRFEMGVNS